MRRSSAMTTAVPTAVLTLWFGFAYAQAGGGMGGGGMGGGGMGGGGTHGSMHQADPGQQSMMGQGMAHNMAMMSGIMNEMHDLMTQGRMTQEHQRQMMGMMNQMGAMMQQMSGPKGSSMEKQHTQQLHEMENRLDTMKDQMGK